MVVFPASMIWLLGETRLVAFRLLEMNGFFKRLSRDLLLNSCLRSAKTLSGIEWMG